MPRNRQNSDGNGSSGYEGSGSESGSDHGVTHSPYGPVSYSPANISYTPQPSVYPQTSYPQTPHSQSPYSQGSQVSYADASQGKRSREERKAFEKEQRRIEKQARKVAEGKARPPKQSVHKAMKQARFGHITGREGAASIMGRQEGILTAHAGVGGSGDALKLAHPNDPDMIAAGDAFNNDSRGRGYMSKGETVPASYAQLRRDAGDSPHRLDVYKEKQEREAAIVSDSADSRYTDSSQEGHIPGAYHTNNDTPIDYLLERTTLNEPAINGVLRSGQPLPSGVTRSITSFYPPQSINRPPGWVEDDVRSVVGEPRLGHSSSSGQRTSSSSSDSQQRPKRRPGSERPPTIQKPKVSQQYQGHSSSSDSQNKIRYTR